MTDTTNNDVEFKDGLIFEGEYPPEAAHWCNNSGNHYIEEIDPTEDGIRRFRIVKVPDPTPEELAARALAQAKGERAAAVENITVEVDGMIFQGDETSQSRLSRMVAITQANGLSMDTKVTWVLADNTIAQPTVQQLAKACLLAGQKQTELWTKPYENQSKD